MYYDWENNGGSNAQIIMSGTRSGRKWTAYEMATGSPINGIIQQDLYQRPQIGENVYEIGVGTPTLNHSQGMQRGNPDNDDSYMFLTLIRL